MENHFNSRPSARGDPRRMRSKAIWLIFQFTPLREGRHVLHGCAGHWHSISIHAPPRGATCLLFGNQFTVDFNSRPSARGDRWRPSRTCRPTNFNSRPSARGDRGKEPDWACNANFNSRPSARGDWKHPSVYRRGRFQFTPLREGRPALKGLITENNDFNSRPSARGDNRAERRRAARDIFQFTPLREGRHTPEIGLDPYYIISIHAPPRGATSGERAEKVFQQISIHAPPRGATRCCSNRQRQFHFNSRPSARGDDGSIIIDTGLDKFQFTPLREGRPQLRRKERTNEFISIHAPPRGATPGRAGGGRRR